MGGETMFPAGRWSIPAWAGKPFVVEADALSPPAARGLTLKAGLSPRGRGNRSARWPIPASPSTPIGGYGVYPRVGGETLDTHPAVSGRGRGNLFIVAAHRPVVGSIPAWAGKPVSSCATYPPRVYPRVGGETTRMETCLQRLLGLSPRGRGNP